MLPTFRVLAKLCAQLSSMLIDGNNGLSKLALGSVEPTKALKTLRDKIIVLHMYGKEEKCIIYTYNWLATTEKLGPRRYRHARFIHVLFIRNCTA
jgi:hypothetical protein